MSGFELQPLSLGELLDRAFLLYRRNFRLFAGIMLIPSCAILPLQFFMLRGQGAHLPWEKPAPHTQIPAYSFGFLFVYWLIYAVVQAAKTFAVADAYLGRRSTIREAYGKIRGRFWRVIGVTLNVGARIFGLLLLLLVLGGAAAGLLAVSIQRGNPVPGVLFSVIVMAVVVGGFAFVAWFSLRYAVSLPAVLLEDLGARAAIRRSVQLSRGRRGQIFVAILLALVVLYSVAILFQGPFYAGIALLGVKGAPLPNWLYLGMAVASSAGGIIAGPVLMIILVLCYYDLRIRKEGFDLQHMMTLLPDAKGAEPVPLA